MQKHFNAFPDFWIIQKAIALTKNKLIVKQEKVDTEISRSCPILAACYRGVLGFGFRRLLTEQVHIAAASYYFLLEDMFLPLFCFFRSFGLISVKLCWLCSILQCRRFSWWIVCVFYEKYKPVAATRDNRGIAAVDHKLMSSSVNHAAAMCWRGIRPVGAVPLHLTAQNFFKWIFVQTHRGTFNCSRKSCC